MDETMGNAKPMTQEFQQGSILASVVSPFMMGEKGSVQFVAERAGKRPLHVVGDLGIWEHNRIDFVHVEGTPWDVKCRSNRYVEFWLIGMPERSLFPRTIVESKRVLAANGVFRMNAPFVFFDDPEEPNLEAFIRVASTHLFPELGVVEGQEICRVFRQLFGRWGVVQFYPDYVQFWGVNQPVLESA